MNEIVTQLKNLWSQMDNTRRIIAGVVMLLVVGLIIFVVVWANAPRYQLLYSSLTEADRSDIITHLEEMKIPYRTTSGGGIEVPNAVSVRANLLKEGIPRGGVVGWEIFDQNSFSATDFSNEINRQRAIAGELTRTLQRMDGISDAKVLLNLPDPADYLFAEDKPEGTVSVQLQLRAPGVLSQSQVEAIANLTAASTGIRPENVTIIDNFANDLTAQLRSRRGMKPGISTITDTFAAKIEYETQTEKRLESMLAKVFGFNKAVVRVNADLDLDYQEIKSETYGEAGVPRSEQERSEIHQSASNGNAMGVPGTDSNITQYKAVDNNNSGYRSEKSERTVNYELNKVEEFRISAPGKVKRLSVGVWVDGNLPAATRQKVENTIAAAVGISEERGDMLTVETIQFTRQPETNEVQKETGLPIQTMINYGLVALLIVGLLFVLKKVVIGPTQAEGNIPGVGGRLDTMIDGNAQMEQAAVIELSPEERMRIERISQLEKLAMEKPEEIASLLRSWLSEDY
ncbi:MAG TPA: flagellar basal-body MS-ring/collar protein FliF [Bacillota bacterium]|nr:flagellar basal-body MS-ring/collar protein FliF [Bacillota bacterium]HPT88040.1 flagellar basal-body MS-ring/collar protein FliF [Bacillota bacterium]